MEGFILPEINDAPQGWGPTSCVALFKDVPFAPYNKGDRLGRISDWSQSRWRGKGPQQYGQGQTSTFAYKHDNEDETTFSLVDNKPKPKLGYRRYNKMPFRGNFRGGRGGWGAGGRGGGGQWTDRGGRGGRGARGGMQRGNFRGGRGGYFNNGRGNTNGYRGYNNKEEVVREPSVPIDEKWEEVAELDIEEISNELARPGTTETLISAGTLEKWNEAYDRISPKQPKMLQRFEANEHYAATTSADPYIKKMAAESKESMTVYATDVILGLLMSCGKSVNPWDILVRKTDKALYFDKRSDSKCVDFLSVNENLKDSSLATLEKDNVNVPENLSQEATLTAQNLSQQVVSKDKVKEMGAENPLTSQLRKGEKPASTCFRYRKFALGQESYSVVTRTQLHGFMAGKENDLLFVTKVLNEFDSKLSGSIDWRQKLETQTGAVLATEMKNNAHRLSRMTAETVLSGADVIQVGFVSRVQPTDSFRHTILMMRKFEPKNFAQSVGVQVSKLWGCLKTIIDTCLEQENGKYVLLRDPNNREIHLFKVPENTWEDETCVFKYQPTEQL